MRNLKRALSLALAAVMVMAMMVVGAGAAYDDFTDKAEIKHDEAVKTLVALNVIAGKGDGSKYDPTGSLTRAEMAKLVTFVLNGGSEPVLGTKATPTYSDIKGSWAEAYIEYCSSLGIIAGDGTGKFNPLGTLTGSQAAKMLLVAMGYNAKVFEFTGSNWEINVNREANDAGLYDELSGMNPSATISRDDAAQLVYNAIQAKLMERSWSQDKTTGAITEIYDKSKTDTLLNTKFGAQIFIGTFEGNKKTGATGAADGEITVYGRLDSQATGDRFVHFPSTLDISNIGEEVKVIFKDGTGGNANQPDKKDTIYGVYNTGKTEVINATVNDIADDYTTAGKVKVDGTAYEVATPAKDDVIVVKNYGAESAVTAATGTAAEVKTAIEALAAQKGDTVKFVCDNDGKIFRAYVVASNLAYVTAKNSETVSLNGIGGIKIADNDNVIYDGIAKNDVVVYTKLYKSDKDDATFIVKKAEVVSGEVKGYKGTESIKLDGTDYKIYNKSRSLPTTVADKTGTASMSTDAIGEKFDLYLVNGYVGAAVQTSESASNYSLVIANNSSNVVGGTFDDLKIQVLAADGTKTILTVDKDSKQANGSKITAASQIPAGTIITWTGTADKAVVKIQETANGSDYNKTTKSIGSKVTSADCVLFVQTATASADPEYKAYSIRSLGDVDGTIAYVEKDGKAVAAYINLGGKPSGATSNTVYGIVTADNGTSKIGDSYYTVYTLWTTDGEKTVNVESGTLVKGRLYKYDPTSDNQYDSSSSFTAVVANSDTTGYVGAVKSYSASDKLITVYTNKDSGTAPNVVWGGEKTYAVADDAKILYVNYKDGKAGEDIGVAEYDDVKDLYNVIVVLKGSTGNDAQTVSCIIVETSDDADISASIIA